MGHNKNVLRQKFIAIQSHLKKQNFQINNLPLQIKPLEKKGQQQYQKRYGEGGGRGVQDWELMYTRGRFMLMYGKTNIVL